MKSRKKVLEGKSIVEIRTLKTLYDNDSIALVVGRSKKEYRMKVEELLPLLRLATFNIEKKKVWEYATPIKVAAPGFPRGVDLEIKERNVPGRPPFRIQSE